MSFLKQIEEKVLAAPGRLVFPEGYEPRVVKAARILMDRKLVSNLVLLGKETDIRKAADEAGVTLDGLDLIDPETASDRDAFAGEYYELRKKKGISQEDAHRALGDVLNYGAMMVRRDLVDGMVAGSVHATADVLRAAITIVRPAEGMKIVSSCFAMTVPNCEYGNHGEFIYADCGAVPNPDAEQLAYIAIAAGKSCRSLLGVEPVVAMLSFSTKGSASDPLVDKVVEATRIAKELAPDLLIDGELQGDAALLPSVGSKKAPGSPVAGRANTLVFPDLNAGNIAYKLTERLTGGGAYGPLIQGLAKPVNDLSRGCKPEDIVNVGLITQAQSR